MCKGLSLCPTPQGDPVCSRHVRRRSGSGPRTQLVGAGSAGEGLCLPQSLAQERVGGQPPQGTVSDWVTPLALSTLLLGHFGPWLGEAHSTHFPEGQNEAQGGESLQTLPTSLPGLCSTLSLCHLWVSACISLFLCPPSWHSQQNNNNNNNSINHSIQSASFTGSSTSYTMTP